MRTTSSIPDFESAAVSVLARFRGLQAEVAPNYAVLRDVKTPGAARKRFERMAKKGLLAASKLPAGPQVFRLSAMGVKLTGAPPSFADAPTLGVSYDMIAASHLGWRTGEFIFLTRSELDALAAELTPNSEPLKHHGRLLLRSSRTAGPGHDLEWHLHFWLAEFKPAEQLARRIEVIAKQLPGSAPLFEAAKEMGLLGVTVAVPSVGVKATLEAMSFPLEVSPVVVEDLAVAVSKTSDL